VLTWGYIRDLMLTVNFDRLNVIRLLPRYIITQGQNILGQIVRKHTEV
jgi:hypothetical protein